MDFEIVKAQPEDADEILQLQRKAFLSEAQLHDNYDIPPLTQSVDELRADFSIKHVLKAVKEGKIIASGQAYLAAGTCHIGRMAVWPEHQGQGIGSKLLAALEGVFPDALRFEIFTGEKSVTNLAMYEHRGYRQFKTVDMGKTKLVFLEKFT